MTMLIITRARTKLINLSIFLSSHKLVILCKPDPSIKLVTPLRLASAISCCSFAASTNLGNQWEGAAPAATEPKKLGLGAPGSSAEERDWDWGTCLGVVAGLRWKIRAPGSRADGPRSAAGSGAQEDDERKEKAAKERRVLLHSFRTSRSVQ